MVERKGLVGSCRHSLMMKTLLRRGSGNCNWGQWEGDRGGQFAWSQQGGSMFPRLGFLQKKKNMSRMH